MNRLLGKIRRRLRDDVVRAARPHAFYPYLYTSTWHAMMVRPKAAAAEANFLTALPHPGAGIGHQMANWVAGYWFARLFGLRYAYAPFPDPAWEALLDFGHGDTSSDSARTAGYHRVRLPLFNEDDQAEVSRVRRIIESYSERRVLFVLEQDQFHRAQHGVAAQLKDKYLASEARRARALTFDGGAITIAVHVRRGDVSREAAEHNPNLRMRWQEVEYFDRALEQVLSALDGVDARVFVFSQADRSELALFERYPDLRFCLDMGPIDSFAHLAAADILIASKSGFSYGAALLSDGVHVVPKHFWHDYPDDPAWVLADDEGALDLDRLKIAVGHLLANQ